MSGNLSAPRPDGETQEPQFPRTEKPSAGERAGILRSVALGRIIAVIGPLALVALTAFSLLLGNGESRTMLAWTCVGVLLSCIVAVFMFRASSAVKGAKSAYRISWVFRGRETKSRWWQEIVVPALVGPAYIALLIGLGASALEEESDAQEIAVAGARIVAAPVEEVEQLGKVGKGRYDDYRAIYDIKIPASNSEALNADENRIVRVNVLSNEYLAEGDTLYVAYAPDDTGLAPVADEERSQLEQELSGRALSFRTWLLILVAWLTASVSMAIWRVRNVTGLRRKERLRRAANGVKATPAHIEGYTSHAPAANGRPGLRVRCGDVEVLFELMGGSARSVATVLRGESGHLEWAVGAPEGRGSRVSSAIPAEFVSHGGQRLRGNVATDRLRVLDPEDGTESQVRSHPAQDDSVNVVDFGATWPLSVQGGVFILLLLALALLAPLYVLPYSGGLGIALLIASGASVAAAFLYHWNKTDKSGSGRSDPGDAG